MIDLNKVVTELEAGCLHQLFRFGDAALDFLDFGLYLTLGRDVETLAHEGITDFHDSLTDLWTVLENNDVHGLVF